MRRLATLGMALLLIFSAAGCAVQHEETDYAAAIMVDDAIYHLTAETVPGEIGENAIIGYTESYTDTFPRKDGETNFNRELNMPIARVGDGMAVYYEEEWRYCAPEGVGSAPVPETGPLFSGTITHVSLDSADGSSPVVVLEDKEGNAVSFLLTDDTLCQQYFPYTGEMKNMDGSLLCPGAQAEISWVRSDGDEYPTALAITLFSDVSDVAEPVLGMATLRDLVHRKGEALTWTDFSPYASEEIGVGLYVLRYPTDSAYVLLIGGRNTEEMPMYIRLASPTDPAHCIDVRYESIDEFLSGRPEPPAFSFAEDSAVYTEGVPGVKTQAFANTTACPAGTPEEAAARAEGECTVAYDTVNVWYDCGAEMWKVSFSTAGMAGGGQTVYLDTSGITRLIVYGE